MPTRQELKAQAKELTDNKVGVVFIPYLIAMAIIALLSGLGRVTYVTEILAPLALFPLIMWNLNYIRNKEEKIDNFFTPLKNLDKDVKFVITEYIATIFIALGLVLLIVPGVIFSYSFRMTSYLTADTDYSYMDAIKLSRKMMKGHKMELFMMDLSFLGWGLLIALTCGILLIWKGQYIQMTYDLYYLNLKEEYEKENKGTFKLDKKDDIDDGEIYTSDIEIEDSDVFEK